MPVHCPRSSCLWAFRFSRLPQIAFLVDAHRGLAREYSFTHYTLFVTYFPHLIAGPILHHREMMPQFDRRSTYTLDWDNVAVGLTMFIIGLFKKTVIADDMAAFASPAFDAAAGGTQLTLLEAWGAALAYTFQIYFDFSGYTDMALGASRMFGIVLPLNFRSPYKAANIIDFWRRWHITLSRFLRDYVYIPLGGNRKSVPRRYENLLLTMLIGGLWHGAGWTFVFWGALHGIYLVINHGWRSLRRRFDTAAPPGARALATLTTFVAVVVAWVFFRASDFTSAVSIIAGMAGQNGVVLPAQWQPTTGGSAWLASHGIQFGKNDVFRPRGTTELAVLPAGVLLGRSQYAAACRCLSSGADYPRLWRARRRRTSCLAAQRCLGRRPGAARVRRAAVDSPLQ